MPTLWIREYSLAGQASTGRQRTRDYVPPEDALPLAREPGIDQRPFEFSGSTQSSTFAANTSYIAMTSDATFHYVIGSNPVATRSAFRVPANVLHHIGVTAGQKIAVILAA
jgi:hypothetical protein